MIKTITTILSKTKPKDITVHNVLSTDKNSITDLSKIVGRLSKSDDYLIVIVRK
jgi:hypothetical protein